MRSVPTVLVLLLGPAAALAQDAAAGDAAEGEAQFNRQCIACHVVQDASGEVLAGRNARVGPNLHGVIGRLPGSEDGFDYSELMETYGATGVVWEEANFVSYVQDPTGFLREATGQDSGRSKMAYQVRDEQQARDLYAFLATFATAPAEGGEAPAEGEAASE
jgi:cytochrome c